MYIVRKIKIGTSEQLDELALAAGALYSDALVYLWRVVRKKNIWLSSSALEKIFISEALHSHTSDATVQSIVHALKS